MPIHQGDGQVQRSAEHIEHLKSKHNMVESVNLDLSQTYDTFKTLMPPASSLEVTEMGLANSRSRLRMTTLYYLAGTRGYLVAGTGNKVEDFGIGFFTKHGDGGVDISPIADLLKSEVYELGAALGVPQSILDAAPTDGLFGDNRTDEDQLGASYAELEWAMSQAELGKTTEDFTGRQKEVFAIYTHRNRVNRHKMEPIPVCIIPEHLKT
jgi:NAD+ synthase